MATPKSPTLYQSPTVHLNFRDPITFHSTWTIELPANSASLKTGHIIHLHDPTMDTLCSGKLVDSNQWEKNWITYQIQGSNGLIVGTLRVPEHQCRLGTWKRMKYTLIKPTLPNTIPPPSSKYANLSARTKSKQRLPLENKARVKRDSDGLVIRKERHTPKVLQTTVSEN
jgi:hypothetical protein